LIFRGPPASQDLLGRNRAEIDGLLHQPQEQQAAREHDRSHAARRLRSSDEAGRPPELAALLSRMLARHSALITTMLILIAAPSSNLSTTYMFLYRLTFHSQNYAACLDGVPILIEGV
jgi:hypothetical protein